MANNGFIVWASGKTAQLMDKTAYATKAEVGITPGIADLEQANLSWKQSTLGAAVIGELIATDADGYTGVNAEDTETAAQLRTKLWTAINAFADTRIKAYLAAHKFVSFTEEQETTDAEKLRARNNMDAPSASQLTAVCDAVTTAKGA